MTITPSHIIEYLFCPRFTFFEHVLKIPQYEEKQFKVRKGREVHEMKTRVNADYLRKKIGVQDKRLNQYLTNDFLRGEVDEVLFLENGKAAPLDYKFAIYKDRIFDTYKTQLFCYAILIEENFDVKVEKGYLVYTRSKNKLVEIAISDADKKGVKDTVTAVLAVIADNFYPKATKYKKRCLTCTYRNICTK